MANRQPFDPNDELGEALLKRLEVPGLICPVTALPWYQWWPYQPLWAWWWQHNHPRYRCGAVSPHTAQSVDDRGRARHTRRSRAAQACCGSGSQ
jgi:hypothetical protein